ncbi:class I SAM-dependent methyltransferase [Vibrio europaeus]|uniref:class I SAM-dependent methyltransferase n=1 Tax=Vibrio europaeus TaxID=300876 RepID=UPI00233E9567|nr:class I SAM-dependent methyltransferase [Vibrio europaeus]MDC5855933.1 class I SAM-dependent methyltransferase [Vibrio europaeus]
MSEMYTKHALKYSEVVKGNIYNALLERPTTLALLGDVKGKAVVDMGCGSGIYAQWFLEHGVSNLTCVDLSAEMIDLVKSEYGNRLTAYVQDLSKGLPNEASSSADIIVCPLVLHYIEDLNVVLKDVYRVLKPGGYIVFSTHHPFADFECTTSGNYFERERVTEDWNTVGDPVEVSFYRRSLTEISDAVTSSGLFISRISEGEVDERAKAISEEAYQYLKRNPNFIFFRCEK